MWLGIECRMGCYNTTAFIIACIFSTDVFATFDESILINRFDSNVYQNIMDQILTEDEGQVVIAGPAADYIDFCAEYIEREYNESLLVSRSIISFRIQNIGVDVKFYAAPLYSVAQNVYLTGGNLMYTCRVRFSDALRTFSDVEILSNND